MKPLRFALLILTVFALTACIEDITESIEDITESVEDVADSATDLMEEINDISRHVDEKLETGQITEEVADLIDGRLSSIADILESTLQNSGGYIFDRLDGSVDNAFSELDKLLDHLLEEVMGNCVPKIINQIGSQMQLQINTIAAAAEDLVIVTAGQTVYVMDKAFNGLIILISIIILAIGLIVFAIIFLKKGRKLTGANYIGVGLLAIFLAFFFVLALSPSVRGKVLTGFNFGTALDIKEITPTITTVIPENIELGKTKRIYIYGKHLNKLENIQVKLIRGGTEKFKFPQGTLIVNTSNRIVLGNLDQELKWTYPKYPLFRDAMDREGVFLNIPENQVIQVNKSLNAARFPEIKPVSPQENQPVSGMTGTGIRQAINRTPASPITRIGVDKIIRQREEVTISKLGQVKSEQYLLKLKNFFFNHYKIAEGDYGLVVFSDTTLIESSQFVTVTNPPPPAPDPDIFIMGMSWSDGLIPVAGHDATLDIKLGFSHPEQIASSFRVRVYTVPPAVDFLVEVPMGRIAAAYSGNQVVVTTRSFSVDKPGNYTFKCSVDDRNDIRETSETNNTYNENLDIGEYLYDVVLDHFSFELFESMDAMNLVYSVQVDAGEFPTVPCLGKITQTGSTMLTPLNCKFNLTGMRIGETIMLTFHPDVVLSKDEWFPSWHSDLQSESFITTLDSDTSQKPILKMGRDYTFRGLMTITPRKSN